MDTDLIPGVPAGHLLLFVAIGVVFRFLRSAPYLYLAARLPASFAHQLTHFVVGWLLAAQPVSLSVSPYRTVAGRLVFGHVVFARLRWWNEIPIGLSPLLLLPLGVWLFSLACLASTRSWITPLLMVLSWQCLLASVPSFRDWLRVLGGAAAIGVLGVMFIVILELTGLPRG